MKKLFIMVLLLAGLSAGVSAQQSRGTGNGQGRNGSAWVDKNHNNVCDNFENKTVVTNRQGQQRGKGYGQGNGNCVRNTGCKRGNCRRRS